MLELGLKTLAAYLIGSIMGALVVGAFRGVDIRTQGSGNAGGTNALRTQGVAFAAGTVAIDVGKGWVAAAVVPALAIPGVPADPGVAREWLAAACAGAAVVGHVWPQFHGFRGGKGGATLVGALLALSPAVAALALGVWIVVAAVIGFSSVATMTAAVAVPLALLRQDDAGGALLCLSALMAALIAVTHRSNLARLKAGTEPRLGRLWLFGPRAPR